MKIKMYLSLSIEVESSRGNRHGWICNLVDLTPAIAAANDAMAAWYAARAAVERCASRLSVAVGAALGLNKACWGLG